MNKVTIKETEWKIVRWPPVGVRTSASQESRVPIPRAERVGLEFTSGQGDSLFLPMSGSDLPSEEELKAISLDQIVKWMSQARAAS